MRTRSLPAVGGGRAASSLCERLRDDRALCLSSLDALYNDMSPTQRPPQLHHQPPRDPNAREEREERSRTHAPRYDWMDCCSTANLPRLAAHSLNMASKARVTNSPAAPAMAVDLSSGRGDGRRGGVVRSEEGEWAWDGEGARSGGGARSEGRRPRAPAAVLGSAGADRTWWSRTHARSADLPSDSDAFSFSRQIADHL